MLYLADIDVDYARLAGRRDIVAAADANWLGEQIAAGTVLRTWFKANARGGLFLASVKDAETFSALLAQMPIYPYFNRLDITPLLPHRLFPQFSLVHKPVRTARARGQLYRIDLEIDRGKAGPETLEHLIETAEVVARRHVEEGVTVGIWRRLHASGAFIVWDCPDNASLHEHIRGLPLRPYMREINISPLVPHPSFPEIAGWRL